MRAMLAALALMAMLPAAPATAQDPRTVHVFHEDAVHFLPDEPERFRKSGREVRDNGRIVERRVDLGPPGPHMIRARLVVEPVPKDEVSVHDPWDRAGSIRLRTADGPDLEIVKFITAYGGRTEHTVDVTALAPLLTGPVTVAAFIDTWLSPAWRVDFSLEFRPADSPPDSAADWALPLFSDDGLTADRGAVEGTFTVPPGLGRVALRVLVSGHCTDGRDDDEFVTKDNVIIVDGAEVARFRPWRDDCRQFRPINPYCRRWTDGSWSCDYSRSGWCPGDVVAPRLIELQGLAAGHHTVRYEIKDIRPEDDSGKGYWRVSAALLGWRTSGR